MTLEQAVEILNRHKHWDTDTWTIDHERGGLNSIVAFRTSFEAIAIAQAYEGPQWRDKPTCPGLWKSNVSDRIQIIYEFTLAHMICWKGTRYYGPIPPDEVTP